MGYFTKTSTGIFIPSSNGFVEYSSDQGNGSYNSIIESLGYQPSQAYSPIFSDRDINNIFFELFTRNIICIFTNKKVTRVSDRTIKRALGDFSVNKYFDGLEITEVLSEGIEQKSLDISFLARVLNLNNTTRNGFFYAEKIKTYLHFAEGKLTDFHFDDGLFHWAKYLKSHNREFFELFVASAKKYWGNNDFQAKKEINLQCDAFSRIPNGMKNEYLSLHRTENGAVNFYMLLVCHYSLTISLEQFMEINHGRFKPDIAQNQDEEVYRCGKFIYFFSCASGHLLRTERINNLYKQ